MAHDTHPPEYDIPKCAASHQLCIDNKNKAMHSKRALDGIDTLARRSQQAWLAIGGGRLIRCRTKRAKRPSSWILPTKSAPPKIYNRFANNNCAGHFAIQHAILYAMRAQYLGECRGRTKCKKNFGQGKQLKERLFLLLLLQGFSTLSLSSLIIAFSLHTHHTRTLTLSLLLHSHSLLLHSIVTPSSLSDL